MKKIYMIIGLLLIVAALSCEKGEECYECQAKYKGGSGYATQEYCGDWAGVRQMERKAPNNNYENWRCSPK
jgi:hypothetical protein